jgi:hypothetical protein
VGKIVVPRPSASASLTGRRQKGISCIKNCEVIQIRAAQIRTLPLLPKKRNTKSKINKHNSTTTGL